MSDPAPVRYTSAFVKQTKTGYECKGSWLSRLVRKIGGTKREFSPKEANFFHQKAEELASGKGAFSDRIGSLLQLQHILCQVGDDVDKGQAWEEAVRSVNDLTNYVLLQGAQDNETFDALGKSLAAECVYECSHKGGISDGFFERLSMTCSVDEFAAKSVMRSMIKELFREEKASHMLLRSVSKLPQAFLVALREEKKEYQEVLNRFYKIEVDQMHKALSRKQWPERLSLELGVFERGCYSLAISIEDDLSEEISGLSEALEKTLSRGSIDTFQYCGASEKARGQAELLDEISLNDDQAEAILGPDFQGLPEEKNKEVLRRVNAWIGSCNSGSIVNTFGRMGQIAVDGRNVERLFREDDRKSRVLSAFVFFEALKGFLGDADRAGALMERQAIENLPFSGIAILSSQGESPCLWRMSGQLEGQYHFSMDDQKRPRCENRGVLEKIAERTPLRKSFVVASAVDDPRADSWKVRVYIADEPVKHA